jgi:hypothetical protein
LVSKILSNLDIPVVCTLHESDFFKKQKRPGKSLHKESREKPWNRKMIDGTPIDVDHLKTAIPLENVMKRKAEVRSIGRKP